MRTLFDQDADGHRVEKDDAGGIDWESMQPHDFLAPSDRAGNRRCEESIRSRAFARVSNYGERFPDALRMEIAESYANLVRYGETFRSERRAWKIEDVPLFYRGATSTALEGRGKPSTLLEPSNPEKHSADFDEDGYRKAGEEH